MVKVKMVSAEEAKKVIAEQPARTKGGKWTDVCNEVKKTGKAAEVTGITRGQAYALRRRAVELGLEASTLEKGSKVIVLPSE